MMTIKTKPEDFERRILLAVAGGSPAIVTETLYALTQTNVPAYLPTELHIITTSGKFGHEASQKALIDEQRLKQLCETYGIPIPLFDTYHIHRITNAQGKYLTDITTASDNEAAADFITTKVREFTRDENTSLHVSIAGGRKTMSYYMGYAMSLYGRMQDRLSHVLVDESLISRDFFYPQPHEQIEVMLANMPFVRLCDGLEFAEELTQGKHTFSQAIELVQQQFAPLEVSIDKQGNWYCSNMPVQDPKPTRLAVYAWLLERHKNEEPPLRFYGDEPDETYADELLDMYKRLYGIKGISKMEDALKHDKLTKKGMTAEYLRPHISHCNKVLRNSLKQAAKHYVIQTQEFRNYVEYHLPSELMAKDITLDIP